MSEFHFNGLIMTDDLDMGAIINEEKISATVQRAMLAGNHLAMVCHRVHLLEEARAGLEKVDQTVLDRALAGVDRFKRKLAAPKPFSEDRFRILDREVWEIRVATLGAEAAALRSPDDGRRSPVEIY
jgi:beta-N-acetylhexosaminidase